MFPIPYKDLIIYYEHIINTFKMNENNCLLRLNLDNV